MKTNESRKKIECSVCKEMIYEGALKCRYCGESQTKADVKKEATSYLKTFSDNSLLVWVGSMLAFFVILFFSESDFSKDGNGVYLFLLLSDILFGGIAFVIYLWSGLRMLYKGNEESGLFRLFFSIGLCLMFFYSVANFETISSYVNLKTKKPEVESKQLVLPTQAVTPTPTTVTTKKAVTTKKTVTNDGSRTGNIIDYYSYCEKKTVKVYENELVPYTTKAGKQIYSTKGDISCYEAEYNGYTNQTNQVSNPTRVPVVIDARPLSAFTANCDSNMVDYMKNAVVANNKMYEDQGKCISESPPSFWDSCYSQYPIATGGKIYSDLLNQALTKYCNK